MLQIGAVEKRKLLKAARALDYPKKNYIFKIFSCLVFLLVRGEGITCIRIDKEYPGHEDLIRNYLYHLFAKHKIPSPEIQFVFVTKKSKAHKVAIDAYRGKRKADITVKANEVIKIIYA